MKHENENASAPSPAKSGGDLEATTSEEDPDKFFEIHFQKSNHFRTIHCDGAWGGVKPNGDIQCAFYSERAPIPQLLVKKLKKLGNNQYEISGSNDDVVASTSKSGTLREIEVSLVMSRETALSIHDWLGRHLEVGNR